jgi:hypothetical protein
LEIIIAQARDESGAAILEQACDLTSRPKLLHEWICAEDAVDKIRSFFMVSGRGARMNEGLSVQDLKRFATQLFNGQEKAVKAAGIMAGMWAGSRMVRGRALTC